MKLNFYDKWDLNGFGMEHEQELFKHVCDNYIPSIILEGKDWTSKACIEENLLNVPYQGTTPWFGKWREFFIETTKFQTHELVDQPVAMFFMLTTTEPNIQNQVKYLNQLINNFDQYKYKIYNSDVP